MKSLIPIITFLIALTQLKAQPAFQWAKSFGRSFSNTKCVSIAVDPAGNTYSIGEFSNTVDFDPSPCAIFNMSTTGNKAMYFTKFDANGNFLWAKSFTNFESVNAYKIKIDNAGNLIIAGRATGSGFCDLDTSPTTSFNIGYSNALYTVCFLAKYDGNGNFIWGNKMFEHPITSPPYYGPSIDFDIDPSNSIYITGSFKGIEDFDFSTTGSLSLDAGADEAGFLMKISTDNTFIYAKEIDVYGPNTISDKYARGYNISVDNNGTAFITGAFKGNIDFHCIPTQTSICFEFLSSNIESRFLARYDNTGRITSSKKIAYGLNISDINVDSENNLFLLGNFTGTVSLSGISASAILNSRGNFDIFLLKFNNNCAYQSVSQYGTAGCWLLGNDLLLDESKNLHIQGTFDNIIDFDNNSSTANSIITTNTTVPNRDLFIAKLNPAGIFIWAKSLGTNNYIKDLGFAIDINHNLYSTGEFAGTNNFSNIPQITSLQNAYDSFIFKLSTNKYTINGGNWYTSSVWSTGSVPTSLDDVKINSGHSIILNHPANAKNIANNGNIVFFSAGSITLNQ